MKCSDKFYKILANLGLLAAAAVLSLLFLEMALWFIFPKPAHDEIRSFEYRHSWKLNSDGFRDDDFAVKNAKRPNRIIFLGDSFVTGMGVERENSFAGKLSKLLEAEGFESFNLGKIGTGTIDQSAILIKHISAINPAAVFLFFYWNDPQENLSGSKTGSGEVVNPKGDQFFSFLYGFKPVLRKSLVYQMSSFYFRVLANRLGVAKLDSRFELDFFKSPNEPPQVKKAWDLTEAELVKMKGICAAHGAGFFIFYVPKREQLTGWDKLFKFYHANPGEYDRFSVNRRLNEICRRLNVLFTDVSSQMDRLDRKEALYYKFDTHFTILGSRVYSDFLKPHVLEKLRRIS